MLNQNMFEERIITGKSAEILFSRIARYPETFGHENSINLTNFLLILKLSDFYEFGTLSRYVQ